MTLGDGGRVRDALDQRARFVADRLERVPEDLECDRIEAESLGGGCCVERHRQSFTEMTMFRYSSTRAEAPGGRTTVLSVCSAIAGPSSLTPLRKSERS